MGKAASVGLDAAIANTLAAKDATCDQQKDLQQVTPTRTCDLSGVERPQPQPGKRRDGLLLRKTVQNVRDAINAQGALGNQVNGDDLLKIPGRGNSRKGLSNGN